MNKRKILALAMALSMVAILAVGATLAYFTDTDKETNVFTVGDVAIDLTENFKQNSELFPTTGEDENGNIINAVEKKVYVTSTGSEEAYVRVHIAIPQILDNGNPNFDAGKNVLHFNYAKESIGAGLWDWSKTAEDGVYEGNWNYYETEIGNIKYNVYVVTYGTALAKDDKTVDAMHQVYLDRKVTNKDIDGIKKTLGDNWKIYVVAEGAQAEGFDNAYDALNTAFGTPGNYAVEWVTAAP